MVGPRPKFFNVGSVGRLKEMEVDGTPKVGGLESALTQSGSSTLTKDRPVYHLYLIRYTMVVRGSFIHDFELELSYKVNPKMRSVT